MLCNYLFAQIISASMSLSSFTIKNLLPSSILHGNAVNGRIAIEDCTVGAGVFNSTVANTVSNESIVPTNTNVVNNFIFYPLDYRASI